MSLPETRVEAATIEQLSVDVCVVGGGMAGLCTAVAAARHGARVALVQDRAVLGGNASSEVRMWICGAHGKDNKETGILEAIQLRNLYRNAGLNYAVWDTVLHETAAQQPGLTLLLSCAVCEVTMADPSRIASVRAWHLTRHCWMDIAATQFADCSGDSILRLSGAAYRWGREARAQFNEPAAPETADRRTMGNSILIQLREVGAEHHRPFTPPEWAHHYTDDTAPKRRLVPTGHNFWWLEIGGEDDTIADADALRDELLRVAYGVWAYIKNHPDGRGKAWELEWIGALPGKRENVRYIGDHVLTQHDIESGGDFDDVIAHGGWTMDDHHPGGIQYPGDPTCHHPAPSPYGIPYRCLYHRDVGNLSFAGRNISATHMAMSSTRVMATCAVMGQAVGTALAIAIRDGISPRAVGQTRLRELQNTLLDDDQYLPGWTRPLPALTAAATLQASAGDPTLLADGIDRHLGDDAHAWTAPTPASLTWRFEHPREVSRVRLIGDSQLHRTKRMPCNYPAKGWNETMPAPLPRDLRVEAEQPDGTWLTVATLSDQHERLIRIPLAVTTSAIRVTIDRAWGDGDVRLFAADVGEPDLTTTPERHAFTRLDRRARATA